MIASQNIFDCTLACHDQANTNTTKSGGTGKKGKIKFKGIRKIKHVGVEEDCWFA